MINENDYQLKDFVFEIFCGKEMSNDDNILSNCKSNLLNPLLYNDSISIILKKIKGSHINEYTCNWKWI